LLKVRAVEGYYVPSFFYMVLETNESVDEAIARHPETFIHEFIHYLQDVLLPYNIRWNLANSAYFDDFRKQISGKKKVELPFGEWSENSKILNKQFKASFGHGDGEDVGKINKIKKDDDGGAIGKRIFSYTLDFENGLCDYAVGARDLLEYIAHKIETKHYRDSHPDLPYKTVDLIFDYYGLSEVPDDVRMSVVEFCLHTDNPIHILFSQLLDNGAIKKTMNVFMNYSACYDALLSAEWNSGLGGKESVVSKADRRLNDFFEDMTSRYRHKQFDDIRMWISGVNNFAKRESAGRLLFSDMFKMDKSTLTRYIDSVTDEIGVPVIMNKLGKGISLLPRGRDRSEHISQFIVFEKFLEYIESNGVDECPVFELCNSWGKMCTDACKTNFRNRYDFDDLCPWFLFIQSYDLAGIEFVYSK